MSDFDPTRWRSDPTRRPPGAELLLRAARRPRPPAPDDMARLGAVIDDIPRRSARSARRVARFASAAVAATTLLALGTGVWAWRGSRRPALPEPAARPALALRETPRTPPIAEVAAAPEAVVTPPAQQRAKERAPGHLPRRDRSHRPTPVETETDALTREIVLIDVARATLETAPAQSLAGLERHRREFPRGQLAAEREFLAVEALRRMGRLDEARRRADELAERYPSSSYAARASRSLPPP